MLLRGHLIHPSLMEAPVVKMKRFMVLFLLLSCTVAFAQKKKQTGNDPWIGNYKLDVAQSKIAGQPPREETVAVSAANKDAVKYTIQGKDAQGNSYTMNYEGKPGTAAPQMAEGKEIAQITYQMPSSHQFTSQGHGADGSTSTGTVTLSQDNKTITVREHSKDPKGAEHDQTMVYVRQ
jgi:heme-binding NEAT domain protein